MAFTVVPINLNCSVINTEQGTVAILTKYGVIEWVRISEDDAGCFHEPANIDLRRHAKSRGLKMDETGRFIESLEVEPHLSKGYGLKMQTDVFGMTYEVKELRHEILDGGERLRIFNHTVDKDGKWVGKTSAIVSVNPKTRRYEWTFETVLECTSKEPVEIPIGPGLVPVIEFNNVYPAGTGRCMLFDPQREYDAILMVDKDKTIWRCHLQHNMHTSPKIHKLNFANGAMAGFFLEDYNPVVIVDESPTPPTWAMCTMYFDLHCGCVVESPVKPGAKFLWKYRILYLDRAEAEPIDRAARALSMEAEDYRTHNFPRLSLGQNDMKQAIGIDTTEDASAFKTEPPKKVWDKQVGIKGGGSLRMTNETAEESKWYSTPCCINPAGTKLRLTGMVKTKDVVGKGMFIRLRPHRFFWNPKPHVDWTTPLESAAVSGTSDWVRVETPVFEVPDSVPDQLTGIEIVLDGTGTAWLTDVGVELSNIEVEVPVPDPVLT